MTPRNASKLIIAALTMLALTACGTKATESGATAEDETLVSELGETAEDETLVSELGVTAEEALGSNGYTEFGSVLRPGEWATVLENPDDVQRGEEPKIDRVRVRIEEVDLNSFSTGGVLPGDGPELTHAVAIYFDWEIVTEDRRGRSHPYNSPLIGKFSIVGVNEEVTVEQGGDSAPYHELVPKPDCGVVYDQWFDQLEGTVVTSCMHLGIPDYDALNGGSDRYMVRWRASTTPPDGDVYWTDPLLELGQ